MHTYLPEPEPHSIARFNFHLSLQLGHKCMYNCKWNLVATCNKAS